MTVSNVKVREKEGVIIRRTRKREERAKTFLEVVKLMKKQNILAAQEFVVP
jgi:hypothetical protein